MIKNNKTRTQKRTRYTALHFLFLLLIPFYGGYYSFSVFLCGMALSALFLWRLFRNDRIVIPTDAAAWCMYGLCICQLLSIPFSVSSGMAWNGFLRTLVYAFFYIYSANYSAEERAGILDAIALEGTVLSLISIVAFFYTYLSGGEDANGRIDGFFEYANTWAIYQLVCLILLAQKGRRRHSDYLCMVVLAGGIFLTGSRSVILLMVIMAFAGGVYYSVKARKAGPAIATALFLALIGGIASLLTKGMIWDRIQKLTLSSSSLNGRLLYWRDGLQILWSNPLGIGHGGYLYIQSAFQTGVYTVRYVHNEYLQAALEGGVAAGVLMLALACFLFCGQAKPIRERAVVFALALHCFVDFDLQFSAIMLLLLFCGKGSRSRDFHLRNKPVLMVGTGFLFLCFAYFSMVYYLDYLGESRLSWRLFPADLELSENYMADASSMSEAEEIADRIIASTDYSMMAWDCKFNAASRHYDLQAMAEAKYKYLLLNRYSGAVWEDFTSLLENAVQSFANADILESYASAAADALERTIRETTPHAWRIEEKPDFSFSEEVISRLSALRKDG